MVKDAEPTPPKTRRSWSWCRPATRAKRCAQRQEGLAEHGDKLDAGEKAIEAPSRTWKKP
jgi:hypothetical protein